MEATENFASRDLAVGGGGKQYGCWRDCCATATVTAGQSATYNLEVTPVSGFNISVALSCAGAPAETTCTPVPTPVTPTGNAATAFAVTLTTTAPSLILPRTLPPNGQPPLMVLRFVPGLLVLILFALYCANPS